MIVLVDQLTPRIKYAFECVFRDIEITLEYTIQESEFLNYPGPKLVYTRKNKHLNAGVFIGASGILDHSDFARLKTDAGDWKGLPTIFSVKEGDIPFDIFGAVFFMLTRFEEYWRFEGDKMGRFKPDASVSHQLNTIERPIVDEWIRAFENYFLAIFPQYQVIRPQSKFVSTIDVDSAFAYKHKGLYRTIGGVIKDIVRFEFKNLKRRISCLAGMTPDPYDTYSYILRKHEHYKVSSIFFFLLADFGEYDKGLPYKSKGLRRLISSIAKHSTIGIHPGVESHKRYNTMLREKSRLEGIISRQVKHSRQHYLMLKFRTTYRLLKSTGIEHDYSLGFAHVTGFRAGTCRPFHWFDLKKNMPSTLMVHPLVVMDTTLNRYMELTVEEAKLKVSHFASLIKAFNGEFVSLWHNENLTNESNWNGWREVFEHTLAEGSTFDQGL